MAAKKKQGKVAAALAAFSAEHNALTCVGIAVGCAVALFGLFCFIVFSGFGASADFIYNQF